MTRPEFLEKDAVLFLHDWALRDYGDLQGIRDEGLLDSALARPLNKLDQSKPGSIDLFGITAAYAFGISSNHAFNDGTSARLGAAACCS